MCRLGGMLAVKEDGRPSLSWTGNGATCQAAWPVARAAEPDVKKVCNNSINTIWPGSIGFIFRGIVADFCAVRMKNTVSLRDASDGQRSFCLPDASKGPDLATSRKEREEK